MEINQLKKRDETDDILKDDNGKLPGLTNVPVKKEVEQTALSPRRVLEESKKILKKEIVQMEKNGVIVPAERGDWVSQTTVQPKSNGKWLLCIDPRPLSKVLKKC